MGSARTEAFAIVSALDRASVMILDIDVTSGYPRLVEVPSDPDALTHFREEAAHNSVVVEILTAQNRLRLIG